MFLLYIDENLCFFRALPPITGEVVLRHLPLLPPNQSPHTTIENATPTREESHQKPTFETKTKEDTR